MQKLEEIQDIIQDKQIKRFYKEIHLLKNIIEVESKLYRYRRDLMEFTERYLKLGIKYIKSKQIRKGTFFLNELQNFLYFLIEESVENESILQEEVMSREQLEMILHTRKVKLKKRRKLRIDPFLCKKYRLKNEDGITKLSFLETIVFFLMNVRINRAALMFFSENYTDCLCEYLKVIEYLLKLEFRNIFKIMLIFVYFNCSELMISLKNYYESKRFLVVSYKQLMSSQKWMRQGYLSDRIPFLTKYILLLKNFENYFYDRLFDDKKTINSRPSQRIDILSSYIHESLAEILEKIGQ